MDLWRTFLLKCMVRREDQTARIIKKVGMILGAVVINALALLLITMFFSIVLVATCLFIYFFWRRIDREYEYIYTDGLLDVDVIFGKNSRKRLLSVDAKEFQMVVPADSQNPP